MNYVHALRNALLPVVTTIGIEAAFLVGGLIVTETVFHVPGVAASSSRPSLWRDYPIVQNVLIRVVAPAGWLDEEAASRRDVERLGDRRRRSR